MFGCILYQYSSKIYHSCALYRCIIQHFMQIKDQLNFAFEPFSIPEKPCGCYAVNHQLINAHNHQRILVPLRSCDYNLEIVNAIVNVTLTQTYQNPTNKFFQVEYSFPISPNSCVYKFVAIFGNTRMEGVIKEKEEAKREYQRAINEGKMAAYGEQNAQCKDILNLKVGNIGPKQEVKIQIAYLQELSLAFNTFYQLRLPSVITPRYLNTIPTQQILAGFRKSSSHQKNGTFTWSFQVSLRTTRKIVFFDSNTHKLELISQNTEKTELEMSLEKACLPNKDFVFSYTTEDYELPSYVFGRTDKTSSVMLSFIPKYCTLSIDDAYKASIEGKSLEGSIDSAKAQYIFLLDRSGSMKGARIKKAKQALSLFIKSLPQNSYFDVISFGTGNTSLFGNRSAKYENVNIEYALQKIKKMYADMGGTKVYQLLFNLLKEKPREGYPKQIFLLTDGGVQDTKRVINMVGNNNKFARLHTIGIGDAASESLIVGCAKQGKGNHVFIQDHQNPSEKIIQLLSDSLSAIITKVDLRYDNQIVESIVPNPKALPYFLKGEIVNFYITFKGQLLNKTHFTFAYEDSQNKLPYQSKIEIDPQAVNQSFIDKMAHFKRIRTLEECHKNNCELEEGMHFVKKVDNKKEATKQSVQHQILSEFTAFICVQKQLIDGKYQQISQTGKVKVYIQNQNVNFRGSRGRGSRGANKYIPRRVDSDSDDGYCQSQKSMSSKRSYRKSHLPTQNISSSVSAINSKLTFHSPSSKGKEQEQSYENISKKRKLWTNVESESEKKQGEREQALIDRIISGQDSSGCWKDISLIAVIFGQAVYSLVKNQKGELAVAAYLIAKWVEKNHPKKQYSLIVRKAYSYAQKQANNYAEFSSLFDQYIR